MFIIKHPLTAWRVSLAVAAIMVSIGGCERGADDSPIDLGPWPPDTPATRAQGERAEPYAVDRFSVVISLKNEPDRPVEKWRSVVVHIQLSELVTEPKQVAFSVGEHQTPIPFAKFRTADNWFVTIEAEILEPDGDRILELRFLSREGPGHVFTEIIDPIDFPIADNSEIADVIEFSNLRGLLYEIGKPIQFATVLKDGRKQPVNLIVADLPHEDNQ